MRSLHGAERRYRRSGSAHVRSSDRRPGRRLAGCCMPSCWRARPDGVRGSGCAQVFGRVASAGCLGGALLSVTQLGDGLGERGKSGDQGHDRQRVIAAGGFGCSEQARGPAQAVACWGGAGYPGLWRRKNRSARTRRLRPGGVFPEHVPFLGCEGLLGWDACGFPAAAQLGQDQIGGELPAAEPHRSAVLGGVAGQCDGVMD